MVDGFVTDADEQFRWLHDDTPWQQTEVLRYERYVPEKRLSASFRDDADPLLRQTRLHLEARYRVGWTGVAALLYRDGEDFQGFHSDRELRWLDDTLVAIVVLGARRPFVFRRRGPTAQVVDRTPAGGLPDDVVLTPGAGDLIVMGGACQRDWLHTVAHGRDHRRPDLADVALDEPARPARHQPDLLRRPPVQRPPAPAGFAHALSAVAPPSGRDLFHHRSGRHHCRFPGRIPPRHDSRPVGGSAPGRSARHSLSGFASAHVM